jgi:hypothetical protein
MSITRFSIAGALLLPLLFVAAARANNVNYNFEQDDGGWTVQTLGTVEQPWTYFDTGSDKGWAAFRGADSAGSGSYLVRKPPAVCGRADQALLQLRWRRWRRQPVVARPGAIPLCGRSMGRDTDGRFR